MPGSYKFLLMSGTLAGPSAGWRQLPATRLYAVGILELLPEGLFLCCQLLVPGEGGASMLGSVGCNKLGNQGDGLSTDQRALCNMSGVQGARAVASTTRNLVITGKA
jgi:hypothetical protein